MSVNIDDVKIQEFLDLKKFCDQHGLDLEFKQAADASDPKKTEITLTVIGDNPPLSLTKSAVMRVPVSLLRQDYPKFEQEMEAWSIELLTELGQMDKVKPVIRRDMTSIKYEIGKAELQEIAELINAKLPGKPIKLDVELNPSSLLTAVIVKNNQEWTKTERGGKFDRKAMVKEMSKQGKQLMELKDRYYPNERDQTWSCELELTRPGFEPVVVGSEGGYDKDTAYMKACAIMLKEAKIKDMLEKLPTKQLKVE